MLHRLLVVMYALSNFAPLLASAAAVDVKYAASASAEIEALITGKQINTKLILLLRKHPTPEYVNAIIHYDQWDSIQCRFRRTQGPLISYTISEKYFPVLLELLSLNAHIPEDISSPDHPFQLLLDRVNGANYTPMLGFIYPFVDHMLKQGIELRDIKNALPLFSHKRAKMAGLSSTDGVLEEMRSYLDAIEPKYHAQRAVALRTALDPVLPPVLQQISVDYSVPADAALPQAPPTTPQNKDHLCS